MAKITIANILAAFASTSAINSRLQQVEDELNNNVLYRDNPGSGPNAMQNDLDLGNNDLLNVNSINGVDTDLVTDLDAAVAATQASEAAAAGSAAAAQVSESAANSSAAEATDRRDEAAASEVNAANSAAAAQYAAAGLMLPNILPGDAGRALVVNPGETGYEHTAILGPATSNENYTIGSGEDFATVQAFLESQQHRPKSAFTVTGTIQTGEGIASLDVEGGNLYNVIVAAVDATVEVTSNVGIRFTNVADLPDITFNLNYTAETLHNSVSAVHLSGCTGSFAPDITITNTNGVYAVIQVDDGSDITIDTSNVTCETGDVTTLLLVGASRVGLVGTLTYTGNDAGGVMVRMYEGTEVTYCNINVTTDVFGLVSSTEIERDKIGYMRFEVDGGTVSGIGVELVNADVGTLEVSGGGFAVDLFDLEYCTIARASVQGTITYTAGVMFNAFSCDIKAGVVSSAVGDVLAQNGSDIYVSRAADVTVTGGSTVRCSVLPTGTLSVTKNTVNGAGMILAP